MFSPLGVVWNDPEDIPLIRKKLRKTMQVAGTGSSEIQVEPLPATNAFHVGGNAQRQMPLKRQLLRSRISGAAAGRRGGGGGEPQEKKKNPPGSAAGPGVRSCSGGSVKGRE